MCPKHLPLTAALGFLFAAAVAAGCAPESAATVDDGETDINHSASAVTCAPRLLRYPIAGPHNGGYDSNWSDFTCAPHTHDNSDYGGAHHGNDLFAARGTPVVAVTNGVVTRSGVASSTSGNRVTIEDSCGWSYYYGHLDHIAGGIVEGVRVTAGQVIGAVGNTGTTTAPHVHFNVHRDGDYNNDTDPFPLLQTVDATSCGARCTAHCEGSVIVGADCGRGDCAAFGSRCVQDALGARCVFVFCPAVGEADICLDRTRPAHCSNGALGRPGDCAPYAGLCSTATATRGHCVSVFCVTSPDQVPVPHDICLVDGRRAHCDSAGLPQGATACPAGTRCIASSTTARCESTTPPAPMDSDASAPRADAATRDVGADHSTPGDASAGDASPADSTPRDSAPRDAAGADGSVGAPARDADASGAIRATCGVARGGPRSDHGGIVVVLMAMVSTAFARRRARGARSI